MNNEKSNKGLYLAYAKSVVIMVALTGAVIVTATLIEKRPR